MGFCLFKRQHTNYHHNGQFTNHINCYLSFENRSKMFSVAPGKLCKVVENSPDDVIVMSLELSRLEFKHR